MEADTRDSAWKEFIRKHYSAIAAFAIAVLLAIIAAVYVFLWFVANAQSSSLVPASLGLWSMRNLIDFILNAIFWELLLVGIPVVVGAAIAWQWCKRIPEEEWRGMRFGRRFRRRPGKGRGGGGGGLLFFIAFSIKVYLDGNWNEPISMFSVNYVVNSMVLILEVLAIIFGIPATIAGVWWLSRELKKP